MNEASGKIAAGHLGRDAYLYVRQSTVRQVDENTESTRRQHALRERAVSLGWPAERVVVIDTDLGQSGADLRTGAAECQSVPGAGCTHEHGLRPIPSPTSPG